MVISTAEHPLVLRLHLLGQHFERFVRHHGRLITWTGFISFVVIFTGLGAWKLWAFGYNALDLAIYRQVAANSIHGHIFAFTVHPHSYLGDHFELFYAVLWPFYALAQHPLTLLFLQNVALAGAVWPLTAIAARIIGKPWHALVGLAWLANPTLQNMALFEFHLLPFAMPIISLAMLAYLDRHFGRFLLFCLLAVTVREDVALVIIGFGALAIVDRRRWRWSLGPILIGSLWFFGALKLTGLLSGYGHYKFISYYSWLGQSSGAIIHTALTKPWLVISHLVQLKNIFLSVGLLLPFAFLPLVRSRWLIPIIPIVLQIFLVGTTSDALLEIHYPALLLPFFLVASMSAIMAIQRRELTGWPRHLGQHRAAILTITSLTAVYAMVVIGPIFQSIPVLAASSKITDRVRLERAVIESLPTGGVVAGLESLTDLSSRSRLFSLHYVFLGQKQYSQEAYVLPDDVTTVILDQRDFLYYQLLYQQPDEINGFARIRTMLQNRGFVLTTNIDRFSVWQKQSGSQTSFDPLYTTNPSDQLQGQPSAHGPISFLGWTAKNSQLSATEQAFGRSVYTIVPFSLVFKKNESSKTLYQAEFTFRQRGRIVYQQIRPLGGGIFPTTGWSLHVPVASEFRLLVPSWLHGQTSVSMRVMNLSGRVGLNALRSAALIYTKYESVGPSVQLGNIHS